jgi:Flp pilus assembly protein CpaB
VSSRRTAILIGAIAVGIVAVVLIWQYVRTIEDKVYEDSQPTEVYLAQDTVPRGTDGGVALDSKLITTTQIPQKYRPATAITSADALQKKVALFDISPGTVIVDKMFVDPATSQISFRQRLKNKTHVAISIQVDQVRGVGGFLVPGDEVNMMIMQDNAAVKDAIAQEITAELSGAPGTTGKLVDEMRKYEPNHNADTVVQKGGAQWMVLDKTARYLYQKVQILAVGSSQLLSPGEQASTTGAAAPAGGGSGLITFNVPAQAAQWIATGADKGFYLSLVPKDYQPTAIGPLPVVIDTLPGEDATKLCPYVDEAGNPDCAPKG